MLCFHALIINFYKLSVGPPVRSPDCGSAQRKMTKKMKWDIGKQGLTSTLFAVSPTHWAFFWEFREEQIKLMKVGLFLGLFPLRPKT